MRVYSVYKSFLTDSFRNSSLLFGLYAVFIKKGNTYVVLFCKLFEKSNPAISIRVLSLSWSSIPTIRSEREA